MKHATLTIILGATLCGNVAQASEEAIVSGAMVAKCSKLTSLLQPNADYRTDLLAIAMISWARGYISAINVNSSLANDGVFFDMGALTDVEFWGALYGYCKRNPDSLAIGGVKELISRLPLRERRETNSAKGDRNTPR